MTDDLNMVPDQSNYAPKGEIFTVGYARPPIATRFKKGQSGNPKGRPKGRRKVWTELRDVYTGTVPMNDSEGRRHISRLAAVLRKQWERSIKGSERATT